MRPTTVSPSRMASGGSGYADLDLKGRVAESAAAQPPHPAGRLHLRVVAERDVDQRVVRAIPDELLGTSKTASRPP